MEKTSVLAQSTSEPYSRVANPLHTILMLAVFTVWTFEAKILADQMKAAANPNRVRVYLITIFVEWFFLVLIVAGVRRSGASVLLVLGDHWHSARQVLRDIGIAAGFWVIALALLWVFARLLRVGAPGRNIQVFFPHGGAEITLWIALSVTAGICEETIFRGYLQRQFLALTQSAPAGIILSAAAFGAAHAWQGVRMAILIGLFGAMFGILAYWRGSVRPGMIVHAWQDTVSGLVGSLIRH
ncbi:MAG: type II CAAX endopeptidase family protein [Terriglobales bacterium]